MDALARAAAARADDLGEMLGIEISPKYREIMAAVSARPSPGDGPGWPIHRAVLAAAPALSAYFATVDDQAAAQPPTKGRWGAVRRWRQIGAGLQAPQ